MAVKQRPTDMDHKQPNNKDRSNDADTTGSDRQSRERRSGEGADSALANLKTIERDRRRSRPADDDDSSSN